LAPDPIQRMRRPVVEVMTDRVVTVDMDDRLGVVRDIFQRVRFHHLMVLERERLVGIISDRDLFAALSPYLGRASETERDLATLEKRAHQVMSRHPVTIGTATTLGEALECFNTSGMSCLPVVNDDGGVAGVMTWRDLVRAIGEILS
jgi:acetoin utilization protein AcuB